MEPVDEKELIRSAQNGSRIAIEKLLLLHCRPLKRHIEHSLRDQNIRGQTTDDVLQEALTQAFRRFDQFQSDAPQALTVWLRRIAENCLLDSIRHENRKKRGGEFQQATHGVTSASGAYNDLLDLVAVESDTPSVVISRSEAENALQIALSSMSERSRNAIRKRYIDGDSYEQIAAAMDCTRGAVHGLIKRGKQQLCVAMGRASAFLSRK